MNGISVTFDIGTPTRVRPRPLGKVRSVADVHLGELARHLRLVGLDTAYRNDADDAALADLADREGRILLTRDQGLLKRRTVAHGYFVRETQPHRQLVEVLRRFGPLDLQPFSRCLRCNDVLREVPESAIDATLLPRTRYHYDQFETCNGCGRVYWRGSHWKRLKPRLRPRARRQDIRPPCARPPQRRDRMPATGPAPTRSSPPTRRPRPPARPLERDAPAQMSHAADRRAGRFRSRARG